MQCNEQEQDQGVTKADARRALDGCQGRAHKAMKKQERSSWDEENSMPKCLCEEARKQGPDEAPTEANPSVPKPWREKSKRDECSRAVKRAQPHENGHISS